MKFRVLVRRPLSDRFERLQQARGLDGVAFRDDGQVERSTDGRDSQDEGLQGDRQHTCEDVHLRALHHA